MSAIYGILRFDGAPIDPRDIDRMGAAMAHRGPDDRQAMTLDGVVLGQCLLRVNREDLLEAQPVYDRDAGLLLVADARLDNREAVAAATGIAAASLADMPDSALLLAAYRNWGEACVDHLIGDFAFAVWNTRTRTLVLVRDHMGQRGLHFHHGDGFFAFATEIKALWAVPGVPRVLLEAEIGRRLLMTVDQPPFETLYAGIAVLPGATTARIDAGGSLTTRRYWEPHAGAEHLGRDEAHYRAAYVRIVEEAVACRVRRLIAGPGLLFSGGFDSGSIAALAGPIVQRRGQRIVAVASVLPEGERRMVRDARAAVEAFRALPYMDIHYYIRGDETIFTDLEASFASAEDSGGTHYVRRGLFRLAAQAGARLVLDGHGGDYTVNTLAPSAVGRLLRRGKLPRFAREFRRRMRVTGRSAISVFRFDVAPALASPRAIRKLLQAWRGAGPLWRSRGISRSFAADLFARGAADATRLRDTFPLHGRGPARWAHILRRTSTIAPGHAMIAGALGLDLSRPFHDKRVVELGLAIPEDLRFRDGLERHLARTVLADWLPAALLARGPGNDAEQPDRFRMMMQSAPAALAAARTMDDRARLSRYVDLDQVEAAIGECNEARLADHYRLNTAMRALVTAHFVAWFDRSNR